MKILVLDDDRGRLKQFMEKLIGHDVCCVETAQEAIRKLKEEEIFDYAFFDHDLGGKVFVESGGQDFTGWDVAVWLTQNIEKQPKKIVIHSFNPAGAANMKSLLPQALLMPGVWGANLGEWLKNA